MAVISREGVEAFITDQLARWRPATAANPTAGCSAVTVLGTSDPEIDGARATLQRRARRR